MANTIFGVSTTAPLTHKTAYEDVVTRSVSRYEVLSAQDQLELWELWRTAEATGAEVYCEWLGTSITAMEAQERLLGANFRLAISEASAAYERTSTKRRDRAMADDLRGEAYAGLSEALALFDPAKGSSLAGFVTLHVRSRLQSFLHDEAPVAWARVARMASNSEQRLLVELGRAPTSKEIKDAVIEYALGWAGERLIEAGADPSAGDLAERAKRKLVKQGTWAAIERLDEVRAVAAGALSLDAPVRGGESTTSLIDLLADGTSEEETVSVLSWFLESLDEDDRSLVVRRFGLDSQASATYEELGETCGVAWTEVRERLNGLLGRLIAPHAMFLSCDEGLAERVEHERAATASSRLVARRSAVK
jgi:DNA-directed RNA polymerase sigma subunit (sigma70/sigma32)